MKWGGPMIAAVLFTLLLGVIAYPSGDCSSTEWCGSASPRPVQADPGGSWSLPLKTLVGVIMKATKTSSPWTLALPTINVNRTGTISGSVEVGECDDCCEGETPRLAVRPTIEAVGTLETAAQGYLKLPSRETSVIALGPTILDARSGTEIETTDGKDRIRAAWEVSSTFTIREASTAVSLGFLGFLDVAIWEDKTSDEVTQAFEEAIGAEDLIVTDTSFGLVTPYCSCVAEGTAAEDIEEEIFDAANHAPLPNFQGTIDIPLRGGFVRIPGGLDAVDPEGDPLWIYVVPVDLDTGSLEIGVNQRSGDISLRVVDVSESEIELLANTEEGLGYYLYDLKPDVVVEGEKPEPEQYYNKVHGAIGIRFVDSSPPEAIDVEETLKAEDLEGCVITAKFQASDDDPRGARTGAWSPDGSTAISGRRLGFRIPEDQTLPLGFVFKWAQWDDVGNSGIAFNCLSNGTCEAQALFEYQGSTPCPPPGDYTIQFEVYEVDEQGVKHFPTRGTYTLHLLNTLPIAQDDAFTMRTNASGASRSINCDVLANDRDPDDVGFVAIQVVEGKGPYHGAVKIEDDLTVTYTSNEGHGGVDSGEGSELYFRI